mmetsp:Transcript_22976/g.41012  ORF Transcript_22976/g.41012 Transcript_22976/m.41012 type:complete len:696 (+) Transcript_22976:388-2475(+)
MGTSSSSSRSSSSSSPIEQQSDKLSADEIVEKSHSSGFFVVVASCLFEGSTDRLKKSLLISSALSSSLLSWSGDDDDDDDATVRAGNNANGSADEENDGGSDGEGGEADATDSPLSTITKAESEDEEEDDDEDWKPERQRRTVAKAESEDDDESEDYKPKEEDDDDDDEEEGQRQKRRTRKQQTKKEEEDEDSINIINDTNNAQRVSALGPISTVQTFHTNVPRNAESISSAQREFMSFYYKQDAANKKNDIPEYTGRKRGVDDEDRSVALEDSDREDGEMEEDEVKKEVKEVKEEDVKEEEEEERIGLRRSKRNKGKRDAKEETETKIEEDATAEVKEEEEEEEEEEEVVEPITMKGYCATLVRTNRYNTPKKPKEDVETVEADDNPTTTPVPLAPDLAATNPTDEDDNNDDDDDNKNDQAPQVEVINGQITIAEDSLLANPTSRTSTALIDAEFGDAVVDDDDGNGLGIVRARHDSFKPGNGPNDERKKNGLRWGVDETKAFYRALRQCGADFGMMQHFCEGRTRAQLKRKFKVESRRNPRLVDMSLDPKYARTVKLDLSVFGDKLEISDELPTFTSNKAAKKEEPLENDDDGDDVTKKEEIVIEEDYDHPPNTAGRKFDAHFEEDETKADKSVTFLGTPTKKSPARKAKEDPVAAVPLAILGGSSLGKKKKKARFRVKAKPKPKGKTKAKKK